MLAVSQRLLLTPSALFRLDVKQGRRMFEDSMRGTVRTEVRAPQGRLIGGVAGVLILLRACARARGQILPGALVLGHMRCLTFF